MNRLIAEYTHWLYPVSKFIVYYYLGVEASEERIQFQFILPE